MKYAHNKTDRDFMKTAFKFLILLSLALTACKEEQKNEPSSNTEQNLIQEPTLTASKVCSIMSIITGIKITCGDTSADLTNGLNGEAGTTGAQGATGLQGPTGPTGATGPQGPPGNSSSPYLVLIDKNNNQIGTFIINGGYTIWDDPAGGFVTYNPRSGYVNSLSGAAYLTYLSTDCSGQAYLPTATEGSNSFPENTITYMNGQFYKIGHVSINISGGTTYSYSVPSGDIFNSPNYSCHTTTINSYTQGTYNEANPISTNLPIRLALPVRIERR